jgi:hypothetical protein
MKILMYFFLVGSTLLHAVPASAKDRMDVESPASQTMRAVNIILGNSGQGLDSAALRSVRKLVGQAVAADTVDSFLVYSPREGGPIPIEGGLSACAEAGFNVTPEKFGAFVMQLRSIHPKAGTSLNVESVAQCKPAGL